MIQSMTGYGKATATFGDKKINVEIKSLNSKAMDLSTRIAPLYREKEMEIRNLITKTLERGKVDFSIWIEKDAAETATPINAALVENYYNQILSHSCSRRLVCNFAPHAGRTDSRRYSRAVRRRMGSCKQSYRRSIAAFG